MGANGEIVSNLDWERIATENTETPYTPFEPRAARVYSDSYAAKWWRENKARYLVSYENGKRIKRVIESERRKAASKPRNTLQATPPGAKHDGFIQWLESIENES
jgi:hypothetical protein